ncbi:unnamed protein product [Schistocephalus solidus]|uniref:CREB-regulated transcription coactivator 1 n=1 Tax=Schistocephalus solidus TaxID=70667 RepID=A0A183TKD8_SCHSO|nr:unnamed protein product [Schistocephalus solidus]
MMHRQKSSRVDGLTNRKSLLMGEPRQPAGWQSANRPLPKQTPQSAVTATTSPPPPPPPHQQRSSNDFEVHRRRNSQPNRSSGQQQQHRRHQQHPHHHSLTRNSFSGRSCPPPSSLGVANQRVTEWLRTAGALPEETEFESLDMSAAVDAAGEPPACPRPENVPDMARWSRNSGLLAGTTTAAPHYPTVTHNSAYALQSPSSSVPPTGGAVTYDRRMRPAVPVHAAPKGQAVRLPEAPELRDNFSFSGGGGDAFSNLLYDSGCNVVYPRPPEAQFDSPAAFGTEQVEQALTGLNLGRSAVLSSCQRTPQPSTRNRNIPRTNPAFVGPGGQTSNFTMPRLSAAATVGGGGNGGAWPVNAGNNRLSQQAPVGSHLSTFPEFGNVPPQRTDQLNGLHKSAKDKGFSNGFQADTTPSSPDTELTNESASETDSGQEMGDMGGGRDQQNDLLCASRDDDLFESHARFSPVVDEYTFTVDRTVNLMGVVGTTDPPVPPPRTASAEASVRSVPLPPHSPIDATSTNRQSSLVDESSSWQVNLH